jgi:hypothetical protein
MMNGITTSCASWCENPTRARAIHDSTMEMKSRVVVISSAVPEPAAAGSGRSGAAPDACTAAAPPPAEGAPWGCSGVGPRM